MHFANLSPMLVTGKSPLANCPKAKPLIGLYLPEEQIGETSNESNLPADKCWHGFCFRVRAGHGDRG
jgi:hypothetical protein